MTESTYTEEVGQLICDKLEEGMSLRAICREYKEQGVPNVKTILRWLRRFPEFKEQYDTARKSQLELIADEILEIADDDSLDIDPATGKPNNAVVTRDRLRVDTRKFLLVSLMPDKFGQKTKQEISGPDGLPVMVASVPKEELARWVALQLSTKKGNE